MGKKNIKYITTRLLKDKSASAFKEGAENAMKAIGYVIISEDGWLVKKHSNGEIERIKELDDSANDLQLSFD